MGVNIYKNVALNKLSVRVKCNNYLPSVCVDKYSVDIELINEL